MATQSWVYREYRKGLRRGWSTRQEVQDQVADIGVHTQGPELNDELGGDYGVES